MSYGSASARLPKPVRAIPFAPPSFRAVANWDGVVASHPLYGIELRSDDGLILVRTRGIWAVEDVETYFDIMRELVCASRVRFGRAKVLADVTEAPPQSPDVAKRFAIGNEMFGGTGDKLALVTGSSLEKIQIRPMLQGSGTQVFVSQAAALMWINAYP